MKKQIMTSLLVFCSLSFFAQGHRAIDLSREWEGENLKYSAVNNDYCDYYIHVDLSRAMGFQSIGSFYATTIRRGNSYLFTLKRDGNAGVSTGIRYHSYRGDPDSKINIDFPYALPVKTGDSVRVTPKTNSHYTLKFSMEQTNDTVYACREGVVCDDDIFDTSAKGHNKPAKLITIYHKDGSFAEYKAYTTSLVFAGDYVRMGDPVAISEKGGRIVKEIEVGVYFLDKNKLEVDGNKHTHFTPFFYTENNGVVRLEEKTTYIAGITEEMKMQDMSSKEKKKHLKKKQKDESKK